MNTDAKLPASAAPLGTADGHSRSNNGDRTALDPIPAEIELSARAVDRVAQALQERGPGRAHDVVLVWGAGASIPSGVPGGRYLIVRMQRDLEKIINTQTAARRLETRLRAAKRIQRSKAANLEDVLGIYAQIYEPEGLTEWLRQYIPSRQVKDQGKDEIPFYPGFAHEFASHLAHHGHLKTMISLNFDELLEWTMEEEVDEGGFATVASLSEFQQLDHVPRDGWCKHMGSNVGCIVLKPHGTVSRSLTLRHLPQRVDSFEPEKERVLREALHGALVVFLGFGCYNEDFLLLFGETYTRGHTGDIVVVDVAPAPVIENLPGHRHARSIHAYTGTVDEFFVALSARLFDSVGLGATRKPTRHRVRSLFFGLFSRELRRVGQWEERSLTDKGSDEVEFQRIHAKLLDIPRSWRLKRLYELELLMLLLKSGGLFVQLGAASCREVSRAYLEYRRVRREELSRMELFPLTGAAVPPPEIPETPEVILASMLNSADGKPDVFAVSRVSDRYSEKALNTSYCILLAGTGDTSPFDVLQEDSRQKQVLKEIASRYCAWLKGRFESLGPDGWSAELFAPEARLKVEWERFARELPTLFADFYDDYDVDIAGRDPHTLLRFASARSLMSRTHLFAETRRMLMRTPHDDWDKLRVVSVTAGWLAGHLGAIEKRDTLRSIQILMDIEAISDKALDDGRTYEGREMIHYWRVVRGIANVLHHARRHRARIEFFGVRNLKHHMTVVSRGTKSGEAVLDAIYFRRTGKDIAISPVLLQDMEDSMSLVRYFDRSVSEAHQPPRLARDATQRLFTCIAPGNGSMNLKTTINAKSTDKQCVRDLVDLLRQALDACDPSLPSCPPPR